MYGCESWTVKKAEHQRIDAFELWCWRRLLRVPWTPRRSNQSILKEISPGCSLEGLMLKLKLQYFGHVMQRADSLEKTLMLRKIGGRRRRGGQRMRWLDDITDSMDMSLSKLRVGNGQEGLACCKPTGRKESDMTKRLNWTELNSYRKHAVFCDFFSFHFIYSFQPYVGSKCVCECVYLGEEYRERGLLPNSYCSASDFPWQINIFSSVFVKTDILKHSWIGSNWNSLNLYWATNQRRLLPDR